MSEDDDDADLDYVAETPQSKHKTLLKKKTPSKIRPNPFPKYKSQLTKKKNKKPKKSRNRYCRFRNCQ